MSRRKQQRERRLSYFDELAARWQEWLAGRNQARSSESRYWPIYVSRERYR